MLLKEFLDLINVGQKIVINKGKFQCRYLMQDQLVDKFDGLSNYKGMKQKDAEDLFRLSKIINIRCVDSLIFIDLDFISVEKLIETLEENAGEDEDIVYKVFNKYNEIDHDTFIKYNIFEAEVMHWVKDHNGNYCIFVEEDIPVCTTDINNNDYEEE